MDPKGWSWPNAVWSFGLFVVACGVFWVRMHDLRMEIKRLVEALPDVGSRFVRMELDELRQQANETRARLALCEERLGLNGQGTQG